MTGPVVAENSAARISARTAKRVVQRRCACGGTCEHCRKKRLQRKAKQPTTTRYAPAIVGDVLRSSGTPLNASVLAFMELQVGDRADVRVKPPKGPEVGAGGEVFKGTTTGRVDMSVSGGVEVNVPGRGKTRIDVVVTNPQDSRRGAQVERVTEPADRLRLFGVGSSSPAAPRLLAAIEQFIRSRGRGRRPWETCSLSCVPRPWSSARRTRDSREETHTTTGSLTTMSDTQCKPYARQAEPKAGSGLLRARRKTNRNAQPANRAISSASRPSAATRERPDD